MSLANAIGVYLHQEKRHKSSAAPGYWKRISKWVEAFGLGLGHQKHRTVISVLMFLWLVIVIGFIAVLVIEIPTLTNQVVQWRIPLIIIQVVIAGLMIIALFTWLTKNEELGLKFGVSGFILSLVAL